MRFLVYISIFCTTGHSTVFQDLLKYIHSIRLGAKWCALGWKSYDEKFRLRMSQDPAGSWAVVDPDLWLLNMYSPSSIGNGNKNGVLKMFRIQLPRFMRGSFMCLYSFLFKLL